MDRLRAIKGNDMKKLLLTLLLPTLCFAQSPELIDENGESYIAFDPPITVTNAVDKLRIVRIFSPSPTDTNAMYRVQISLRRDVSASNEEDGSLNIHTTLSSEIKVSKQERLDYLKSQGMADLTLENYDSKVTVENTRSSILSVAVSKFFKLFATREEQE